MEQIVIQPQVVDFCCFYERIDDCAGFCALRRIGKEPSLPTNDKRTDSIFYLVGLKDVDETPTETYEELYQIIGKWVEYLAYHGIVIKEPTLYVYGRAADGRAVRRHRGKHDIRFQMEYIGMK